MSENNGVVGERQLVVFDLNSEAYGVDISAVREIIRMQEITRVPRAPEFIEGIINLRGKVIPVGDLRARFSMPGTDRTEEHRIVVVDVEGTDIGMVVDAVKEVSRIPSNSIEPPSKVITTNDSAYLTGIVKTEEKLIILLDIAKVISDTETAALKDVQNSPEAVAA
ncbi:MAG: chemotaxis protein CheW [Dehalococcoidia bacterium]|jgi:purine-binding chemotaxis protein CheW|nr:chemotaxis protein CheW [Dehalococcoidia bacterium]